MEPPPEHQISVVANDVFLDSCVKLRLGEILAAVFRAESIPAGTASISVVSDSEIAHLNQLFRGISASTDVLTFVDGHSGHLADIAISLPTATRQAGLRQVGVEDELAMLVIHAGLHVAGYDDENEDDQRKMVARMSEVALLVDVPTDRAWWSRHYGEAELACA